MIANNRLPLLAALALAAQVSAPLAAQVSAIDAAGRTVALSAPARRVVSLTPAATEILFAVGGADAVVGVTEFCNYPAAASSKAKVGGFSGKTVSIETIVSLKPDLVVVSLGMHQKVASLLDGVGVAYFMTEPRNIREAREDIVKIGTLVGRRKEAEAVAADMVSRVDAVARAVRGLPAPVVFWELWDDPLMSAGGGTFVGEAIELAGGKNAFSDAAEQWPMVSVEQLIVRKPEWILSGDDHGDRLSLEAVSKRPGWSVLPAVRAGRIATVEADCVNRGGPRLADAVEQIARILHPQAFSR